MRAIVGPGYAGNDAILAIMNQGIQKQTASFVNRSQLTVFLLFSNFIKVQ